jgi:hypothetical protein
MAGLPVAASGARTYRRRRAKRSLLYRTVQTHFETWLALRGGELNDADPVPDSVAREFRRYRECGILAHGFARAHGAQCGHDFLIAFSCKGRGVGSSVQHPAQGGDGGASGRSRLAPVAGAPVGAGGAAATALLPRA